MQSLTQPTLLLKPFAEEGDKNNIPLVNNNITNPQLADLTNGFPEITSLPPAHGGLPPERKDFNALGYLTTSYDWFYQAGGTFTFNQTICDAIGGYPLDAKLWYKDEDGVCCILRSTIANNTNNFLVDDSVIGDSGSGKPWEVENFRGITVRGFSLFETKWSDHVLNDVSWLRSDTFSWQSGSVYAAAYNHLVADLDGATEKTDGVVPWTQPVLTAATTTTPLGNIVVTTSSAYSGYDAYKAMDGIKSGTTATTGWGTNNTTATQWWQIQFPYKLRITGLKGYQRYDATPANANTVGRFYTSSSKETPIGDEYNNATSTNWNDVVVTNIPEEGIITDTIYFEKTGGGAYGGLGELEITAERLITGYIVDYYEAKDGHKIAMPGMESVIQDIFNATGVAWYYILDTTNQRFKLPRTVHNFAGFKNDVGGFVSPGLPNITGYAAWGVNGPCADGYSVQGTPYNKSMGALYATKDGGAYGAIGSQGGDSVSSNTAVNIDASRSSYIYGNSTTVQPPATQMYLYFYVGKFSQTAVEQTAGLNAELFNGKMDVDGENMTSQISVNLNNVGVRTIVETYSNGYDWYRIYSDGWVEQGGNYNTALANNYYVTVAFLVPYRDTNYTITTSTIRISGTNNPADNKAAIISSLTTSNFQCSSRFENVFSFMWRAEGFKGDEQ